MIDGDFESEGDEDKIHSLHRVNSAVMQVAIAGHQQ